MNNLINALLKAQTEIAHATKDANNPFKEHKEYLIYKMELQGRTSCWRKTGHFYHGTLRPRRGVGFTDARSFNLRAIAWGSTHIDIGGELVKFVNSQSTYKEYLADKYAPYINMKGEKESMSRPLLLQATFKVPGEDLHYDSHPFNITVKFSYWLDIESYGKDYRGVDCLHDGLETKFPDGFKFPKYLGSKKSYKLHTGKTELRNDYFSKKLSEEKYIHNKKKFNQLFDYIILVFLAMLAILFLLKAFLGINLFYLYA